MLIKPKRKTMFEKINIKWFQVTSCNLLESFLAGSSSKFYKYCYYYK